MDVNTFVGCRIRRRRRLLDMTQKELADACGITFQQVQKYECASNRVSIEMLWRMAAALKVDMAYFFVGLPQDGAPPVLIGDPTGLRLA